MRGAFLGCLLLSLTLLGGHPISLSDTSWPNLTATPNPLLDGLIHAWMLNEGGTNTTSADRVGANPLTLQGGAAWSTNAGAVGVTLSGGMWLDTTAWSVGVSTSLTVVVWARYTNDPFNAMLVTKEVVNGQWQVDFPGAAARFFIGTNTTVGSFVGPVTFPITNVWHQLAGAFSATNDIRYYVDGANDSFVSPPSGTANGAFPDASTVFNVGRFSSFGGGFYFIGDVGPIYIYNRMLSATEITNLYTIKYLFP